MSLQLFPVVWIFLRSLAIICYDRWVLSEGHKKLLQGLVSHKLTTYLSVFDLFLNKWIMAILSKGCKPDNFEPHNLVLWILEAFVRNLLNVNLSLNQTPNINAICKTNVDDSIDFGNFYYDGLSSFNPKRFYYSYVWSWSLCETRTSFCAERISRKLCRFLRMFLTGFTSLRVLLLFLLLITFVVMHVFYSISSMAWSIFLNCFCQNLSFYKFILM